MLEYYENELDRKIRLAREDEARKVTKSIIEKVTKSVADNVASNLLREGCDDEFVHRITGLSFNRIRELKLTL